ncbi:MAG: hypothetical protein M3N50_07985 [Pseudomonadota bacterium]|nr:hypothetical protein [Pseudomonadota bacterium]
MALACAGTVAAEPGCDRACLKGLLDRYLHAVADHRPNAAGLSSGFRQTENAIATAPGSGLWQTMTALGKVQRRYMDPVNGSMGYFGTIEEGDVMSVATLRLKAEGRKITEAEWVIGRPADGGPPGAGAAGLEAHAPPEGILAPNARSARGSMIAAANSFFDGLQQHDGSLVMDQTGCRRVENGGTLPALAPGGASGVERGDCDRVNRTMIAAIAARRFPVVDEQAGVVLGMMVILRNPGVTNRLLSTEWFAIEDGKIRGIQVAMHSADPPACPCIPLPNWAPYDTNWPTPLGNYVPARMPGPDVTPPGGAPAAGALPAGPPHPGPVQ